MYSKQQLCSTVVLCQLSEHYTGQQLNSLKNKSLGDRALLLFGGAGRVKFRAFGNSSDITAKQVY